IVRLVIALALLVVGAPAVNVSFAQDYPSKPVRVVFPFPYPTGDAYVVASTVSAKLAQLWGQRVSVDPRGGDFGTAGVAEVARSAADGYTLLSNTQSLITVGAFTSTLPYNALTSFVPVSSLARLTYVVVVGRPAGIGNLSELVE